MADETDLYPMHRAISIKAAIDRALSNIDNMPQSRELSLARTKLQEAHMWVNKLYPVDRV